MSRNWKDGEGAWHVYLRETAHENTERQRRTFAALMAADGADSASAVIIDATTRRLQQNIDSLNL